jgi:hypothetical protein
VRVLIAGVLLLTVLGPRVGQAEACNFKLGETVRVTGTYVASKPDYARSFAFALQLECGTRDLVTVQRATGDLPVCKPQERVEVMGKLVWNKFLIDGHYEINNPSHVTCVPPAQAAAPQDSQPSAPPAPGSAIPTAGIPSRGIEEQGPAGTAPHFTTAPAPAPPRTLGPAIWVGRYQDNRGGGDVTFSLVRGASTVSGTWKLRTGGGGPVTGRLDETGRWMQFRMENITPECPGTFEGSAEISDTAMAATYRGTDCEGVVTGGTLQLRPQGSTR